VAICNSDPAVMKLATRWLGRLTCRRLGYSIQFHADQDVSELCRFWSETLDTNASGIRLQRKSNSGQLKGRTWRSRYGVITLFVDDTLLRARMQAWMDRLRASWE
jgi:hypothetical protein